MNKTLRFVFASATLIVYSCNTDGRTDGGSDAGDIPPKGGKEEKESTWVTSFEEFGMPLKIEVVDESFPDAKVNLNGNSGRVEVRMDEDLTFSIVNDMREIEEVKRELQQNEVFEYIFFDEGEDRLMYQAKLPTGKVVGHYYMRSLLAGGERYLVATDDQLDLSHYEARRAASVINSLTAVH